MTTIYSYLQNFMNILQSTQIQRSCFWSAVLRLNQALTHAEHAKHARQEHNH